MSKYPAVITEDVLAAQAHISNEEIERDIADTQAEVEHLDHVWEAERTLARHHLDANDRKLYDFKANARPYQIHERREFILFLQRLLHARAERAAV